MSLEAIQKVTEAEQNSRTRKAEAAAEAKRIVAEAERLGQLSVAEGRTAAEEKVKSMMAAAEVRAEERSGQIQAEIEKACAALKEGARPRLEHTAALIVEKVGKK